MHNTTEIEKAAREFAINPPSELGMYSTYLHQYKFCFKAGAEWQKLNSDSTAENKGQQKGMKWVKASERLPKDEIKVCLKVRGIFRAGYFYSDASGFTLDNGAIYGSDHFQFAEWLDESTTDKPEELQEEVERLRAALEKSKNVLLDYEQWEADIIADNRCWEPCGMASNPTIISDLWDNLIEIQAKRNDVLHPGKYTPPQPGNQK